MSKLINKAMSFTIEDVKGMANIFKATTKQNGNTNELMLFALDDNQFDKIIQNQPEVNCVEQGAKGDKVIHELK